jgi:glycosyltransferase involved in cell wall biosynthesis
MQCRKFSWKNTASKALAAIEERFAASDTSKPTFVQQKIQTYISKMAAMYPELPTPSTPQLQRFAQVLANNEKTLLGLLADNYFSRAMKWRVEGPFDTAYSLALLNRETAKSLAKLGVNVALHSTEGPGDFDPDKAFLQAHTDIETLHRKSFEISHKDADVCSRNLYPPRVEDMYAPLNMLHHYAWEESGFPQEWAEKFNHSLDAMTCLSAHVEKIMIDNGVSIPLSVSGCGTDHWEKIEEDRSYSLDARTFRFLHVSSCFPRKGVDVLLQAYGDLFSQKDDVTLVIKTFPNPHNKIHTWLREAQQAHKSYPDVTIIEEDLTPAQLKALYAQCHVLVAPSRAEGFGLPLAEAMISGLSVITTAWGGQLDFCNEKSAWLVEYDFAPADTHFGLYDSVWAEPSRESLAGRMQEIYNLPPAQREEKNSYACQLLHEKFSWNITGKRLIDTVKTLSSRKILSQPPRIGWITSWNTRCGIASYSAHLLNDFPAEVTILASHTDDMTASDTSAVERCWHAGDGYDLEALSHTIDTLQIDTLVLQFNYSFFDFNYFLHFLNEQCDKGRTIILMLHATSDAPSTPHKKLSMLIPALQRCDRILVHSIKDLNRLKQLGLVENTALFPHGIPYWKRESPVQERHKFTLATYGFFLPHKGLIEMIEAAAILKEKGVDFILKMVNAEYPVPLSSQLLLRAKELIEAKGLEKHIELITQYLPDTQCLLELSDADLLIFPYQETGESSSAAVRYGLASGTPVAVTPLSIFNDVSVAVHELSGTSPQAMAASIRQLISEIQNHSEVGRKKQEEALKWCHAHHYPKLSRRLSHMIAALHRQKSEGR